MFRQECESIRPLLSALLDEELNDAEQERLRAHLATCEVCQQLLEEYASLHDQVRQLAPAPPPPPDLWQTVRAEARKEAQRSWFSRWVRVSAAQLSFSSAAVMLLLVVISGFALFQGYQRSINPAIAASFPEAYQRWPVGQPIKITFNKPMNHDSVVENLRIWPSPAEKKQLPLDWQGETLVIPTDPSSGAPLVPDTRYTIMVLPGATDTWGNKIGRAWQVSFEMTNNNSPVLASAGSPAPDASQPPASSQSSSSQGGNKGSAQNAAGSPSPSASASPSGSASPSPSALAFAAPSASDQQMAASPSPSPATGSGAAASPSPSSSAITLTSPPASPDTSPAASPPAAAAVSPAVAAASPSPSAVELSTSQTIPVSGAFGSIYWGKQNVQDRLGAPQAAESTIDAAELDFQRGSMYEWLAKKTVYIFYSDGTWTTVQVNASGADGAGQPVDGATNLWIPPAGFNEAWNSSPSIYPNIGNAVTAQAKIMQGRIQPFTNGAMLYSDSGFVYVIYHDGQWELYPDTSGHGDLITPTPEPSPAASPSADPSPSPKSSANPSPSPSTRPAQSPQPSSGTPLLQDDPIGLGK